jgi:hypothetical protein
MGYRDFSRLMWVFEMAVRASRSDLKPSIALKQPDQLTAIVFHLRFSV